jgi:hypothetical protein
MDPDSQAHVRAEIQRRIQSDRRLLDELRGEIRTIRNQVRRIQPRSTTAISLVGTDGGNNRVVFDPFMIQVVRVVDSSNNEHFLDVISPTTEISTLSERQFHADGTARTALGELMFYLNVLDLRQLSHMIRTDKDGQAVIPSSCECAV